MSGKLGRTQRRTDTCLGSQAGQTGQRTRENFFYRLSVVQRRTPGAVRCTSTGSGGASSSPSEASAMVHSTESSGAGSGSMCLEKRFSWEWSAAASVTTSRNSPSLRTRKRRQPVAHALFSPQRSVTARAAHSAEDWRLVHGQAVESVIEDGPGKSGARLRLDAALQEAEDGHVAGLQVRRASWRDEAQHVVRESGPHGCQCGLTGVDAPCPREGSMIVLPCSGSRYREWPRAERIVVVVTRPFSEVT